MTPRQLGPLSILISTVLLASFGLGCDSSTPQAAGGASPTSGTTAQGAGGASPTSGTTAQGAGGASPTSSTTGQGTGGDPSASSSTTGVTGSAASSGSSGAAQGSSSSSSGTGGADSFTLAWQDDFNTLDKATWQLQSFTYDGNQAQFSPQNATVAGGILTMALTAAPNGAAKPYLGVEMRSAKTLTYGKVSARMRFAKGSGIVSGLVLFYTPFPNCDWNEIDIEHLGNSSNTSQLNAMVYLGAQVPNCATSVSPTQDPLVVNLGFNAEQDFHLYDIEWTPAGVNYIVDGTLRRAWTKNIALLKRPLNILLTIWASNAAAWAGALTPGSAPTSADVDWIKVYKWNGP